LTIVGATHRDQVPDILKAGDIKLDADTMKAIDKVTRDILYPMGWTPRAHEKFVGHIRIDWVMIVPRETKGRRS
jgi:diketogulonate reductase-like aldo/keto reductase